MLHIKFQTSDLVPPPYAHSIELIAKWSEQDLPQVDFQLTYLGREELTDEEITEEGFTGQDDLELHVQLPEVWLKELQRISKFQDSSPKTHLEEQEDFWEIQLADGAPFYPAQAPLWSAFLQEIQQAIFEVGGMEKPLHLLLSRSGKELFQVHASFANRTLWYEYPNQVKQDLPWNKLNSLLREVYSGEFLYEDATQQLPAKPGMYLSLGDDWWFEVGKSYLNSPRRVLKIFGISE